MWKFLVPAALAAIASPLSAQIARIGPGGFTPAASVITFSEFGLNTINPVYTFGSMMVSFAGAFVGQSVTGSTVRTLGGTPTGPLALNTAVQTAIASDAGNPSSPVLSGSPTFNGPISVLFSRNVGGVGLDGGFFDARFGTSITAFRRDGSTIGSVTNASLGIEFFGLASAANDIAGISFFITGNEPRGFAIDNLTFGDVSVLVNPPPTNVVPEPSTYALMAAGLMSLGAVARRRRAMAA